MDEVPGKSAAVRGRTISRRRFLQLGGAGLAGAAMLESGTLAGCGGGEQGELQGIVDQS